MKRLIINADDFGLTPACDKAITSAIEAGAVTSASCLVWSEPSIDNLRRIRGPLGVHLRLTDGRALTDGREFPRSQQEVAKSAFDRDFVMNFVPREWTTQIEAFLAAGGHPTHLDSHRHTHDLPGIREAYRDMCKWCEVAGVPLSARQRDELRRFGVPCADYTEIRWTDGMLTTLMRLLDEDFAKYETVHLMTHPGVDDSDLRKVSTMTAVRARELEVLLSPMWRQWRELRGIELIGMADLKPADPLAAVDIIFCSWNRKRFTQASLAALRENTDWARVRKLLLYDDGSTDGTLEMLIDFAAEMAPLACEIVRTHFRSPVATMNDYLTTKQPSAWFAKLDNDTVVPPGWLTECLQVLSESPDVDLLGIEAKYPLSYAGMDLARSAEECGHIGGIGLMRTAAFTELPVAAGRLGFSDWQIHHDVSKAWLNPALPVILLDRLPMEPWAGLSAQYEAAEWQRPWKRYTDADAALWAWWRK